jgi:hypothetical protein
MPSMPSMVRHAPSNHILVLRYHYFLYFCIIKTTDLKSRVGPVGPGFNFESSFVEKMPSRYKWSRIYFFAKNEGKPQNKPS